MIIIQCRENSNRFPNKWAHEINGVKIIDRVYQACEQSVVRPIMFAIPESCENIIAHCEKMSYSHCSYHGDENDLIKRFLHTMCLVGAERCLRITADCPFHFPQEIDWVWRHGYGVDFCSNGFPDKRTTIDGVDCETYSLRLLRWMDTICKEREDREHLPLYIYRNQNIFELFGFSKKRLDWPVNLSFVKTSIDNIDEINTLKTLGIL